MEKYLPYCFALRSQIHLYHFQTQSYAEHKALEEFYEWLLILVDTLTETYQGSHGRVKIGSSSEEITDYSDHEYVKVTIEKFVKETERMKEIIKEKNSDIQNILDEMIWLGNRTLFLLSLK